MRADLLRHMSTYEAGMNVLFGDGHVEFINEKVARAIWARSIAGVRPINLLDCYPAAPRAAAAPVPRQK